MRLQGRQTQIAIIGAGFGGLAMAIQLLRQKRYDFTILEKSTQIGGTWQFNQYPGSACDVQSHMYSFSFAPQSHWSRRYAPAAEILNYMQDLVKNYDLLSYSQLNTEVTAARYHTDQAKWELTLNYQDTLWAKYVIFASGPLHVPHIPKLPGIEKFKGESFHSSQWNHQYDLKDKKVASIGTGGSAIQYLPVIAPQVKQLYVMQRQAAWVIPRDDRRYLPLEQWLFKHCDMLRKLHRARLYWSNELRIIPILQPQMMHYAEKLAKAWLKYQTKDPALAQQLTPNFMMGCKRILISNQYFPMFKRHNVQLINQPIQEITEDSIITEDGQRHEIDCLIYGTGFITDPRLYLKALQCTGQNGISLQQIWQNGASSYYGVSIPKFPNFFQLLGPNTILGHNSVLFMIESQVHYILQIINTIEKNKADAIVVKDQAHLRFNQHIQTQLQATVWQSNCQSWYQQADGKNFALWPTYTWRYWLNTRKVKLEDYELLYIAQTTHVN